MRYQFEVPAAGSWKRESFVSVERAIVAAQAAANTYQVAVEVEQVSVVHIVHPEVKS